MHLKPVLKSLFGWDWTRAYKHLGRKKNTFLACANVYLHLAFLEYTSRLVTLEWVTLKQQQEKSFSWKMCLRKISTVFCFDRSNMYWIYLSISFLVFNIFQIFLERMFAWLFAFAEKYEVKRVHYLNVPRQWRRRRQTLKRVGRRREKKP